MSPASQGTLEVERYIGNCLISSNVRPGAVKTVSCKKGQEVVVRGKSRGCYTGQNYGIGNEGCQVQYGSTSWAGTPLISMTSSPRRCNQRSSPTLPQQQQVCEQQVQKSTSPLSRLAIHTQGAPLILTGRFHNRTNKVHNGNANLVTTSNQPSSASSNYTNNKSVVAVPSTTQCLPTRPQRPVDASKKPMNNTKNEGAPGKDATGTNISNIDSLSIASDESSGSNNSENSLPRIIKPRKRRKKDRKPTNNVAAVELGKPEEYQQQQQPNHHHQQQQQQHHHHQQQQQHQQHQHHHHYHHHLHHQQQLQQSIPGNTSDQPSIAVMKASVSNCYEPRYDSAPPLRNHRRPPIGRESIYGCRAQNSQAPSMQEIADVRQRYRHSQVKVLDDNRNIVPAPLKTFGQPKGYRLGNHHHHYHHAHHHHRMNSSSNNNNNNNNHNHAGMCYLQEYGGDAVSGCDESFAEGLGLCQCRYCDPSALIWDLDRNGYSAFLASDYCGSRYSQAPLFLGRPTAAMSCHDQTIERLFDRTDDQRLFCDRDNASGCGTILRRSWSDPTSYFSEEISTPMKDVGVIGDRGQTESGKRRTLWRGDSLGGSCTVPSDAASDTTGGTPLPPQGLEVSTEIVTSPNGHRDLEIKFYSSPLSAAPLLLEEDKSLFAEELDEEVEEEEDLSDIWSYHESKLQQDFRTLLQAEE
ncbi:uncharacterized protein [Prorops nasuta]|uniref:uncharacterized protein n=1 Tax=Prorops nasuta TaxID=863751 RepID=UPI0034CE9BA1